MSLVPGARLGPYEIVAPLGAGGMGEVYRARDTRLERTVAIKVLPDALAADPDFRDRFDREARVISQLAHPHICALFDVGSETSTSVSPGSALGIFDRRSRQSDIWVADTTRSTRVRLTFDAADEDAPAWSPTGDRLVFNSGRVSLHMKSAAGVASDESILETNTDVSASTIAISH